MAHKPRIVLLGKQGAGKGTQAKLLSRHYDIAHLSTGDLFRAQALAGTAFGLEAKRFMDGGDLVPDEIVMGVIEECLAPGGPLADGFILDGFPRNQLQAEQLEQVLTDRPIDVVVHLDVPREIVVERLSARRVCENNGAHIYSVNKPPSRGWICDECGGNVVQRDDDTPEAVNKRLDLYDTQTSPLIAFYNAKGLLAVVNGVGHPDHVLERLIGAIDAARLRR